MRRRGASLPTAQAAGPAPSRKAARPPLAAAGRQVGGKAALVPLAALAATTMLAQGDQSSLAQAVTGIQHQFGASDQLLGLIPFGMAVCGGIGGIPMGVLSDRGRRTWLLAAVCAIWTAAMGLGALAVGIGVLFAARMVAGAADGTPPVAISLLSDYFPVRRRSEAMGVYQAGSIVGAFIGLVGGGVAVQLGGWRWAFLIWVPVGVLVAAWYLFLPEPGRGHQDAAFEATVGAAGADGVTGAAGAADGAAAGAGGVTGVVAAAGEVAGELAAGGVTGAVAAAGEVAGEVAAGAAGVASGLDGPDAASLAARGLISLPEPRRASPDEVAGQVGALRELLRIPTMWFGTMFFTVSQLLLNGISFWGVEYFERVHHLGPAAAGGLAAILGVGSAAGILTGGMLADRRLRRGHVNARVHVAAYGAIGATLVLAPAFASTNLLVSAPLLFAGGVLLTIPIAPAEALCTDVVLPQLRGRGVMVRQVVRTGSWAGPYLIGVISDLIAPNTANGLRWAIVAACPLYALGGLIMLGATRYYPRDIAYVIAHCRRAAQEPGPAPAPGPLSAPDRGPVSAPDPGPVSAPDPGPVSAPDRGPVSAPDPGPVSAPDRGPVSAPDRGPVSAPEPGPAAGIP